MNSYQVSVISHMSPDIFYLLGGIECLWPRYLKGKRKLHRLGCWIIYFPGSSQPKDAYRTDSSCPARLSPFSFWERLGDQEWGGLKRLLSSSVFFFHHTCKTSFLSAGKKGPRCPNWGDDDDDDDDNLHFVSWECRWSLRLTNDRWSEQKDSPNTDPKDFP